MADVFSEAQRRRIMAAVRQRDTKPELIVRSLVHRMGFRFRLHVRQLPGTPDIVLPRHHKIIFVNGCFWHGHRRCKRAGRPTTNVQFWNQKLDRNRDRDQSHLRQLRRLGWSVLVCWECETRDVERLSRKLEEFLLGR